MLTTPRVILIVLMLCLSGGGIGHVADIVHGGLFPYRGVPFPLNAFWTSLAGLDFAVVFLLWKRRRLGALLTTVLMCADVAINSYASYGMGIIFPSFAPLQAQTLFLGFVLGSLPLIWKEDGRK